MCIFAFDLCIHIFPETIIRDRDKDVVFFNQNAVFAIYFRDFGNAPAGVLSNMKLNKNLGKCFVYRNRFSGIETSYCLLRGKHAAGKDFNAVFKASEHGSISVNPFVVNKGIDNSLGISLCIE